MKQKSKIIALNDNDFKKIHDKGYEIALRDLSPYLKEFQKSHNHNNLEIASALLILSFNTIYTSFAKDKPIVMKAFAKLCRLTYFRVLDIKAPDKKKKLN